MSVAQAPLRERSIRYVKGVGPQRLRQLVQLGIATLEDACYFPPRRYEDRRNWASIREARPGPPVTIRGRVLAKSLRRIRGGRTIFEVAVGDASGVLEALWFNQPYLEDQVKVGEELILFGELEAGSRPRMIHPEMERIDEADEGSLHMGRIVPIYPLTSGVSQRWLRQTIATVVEQCSSQLEEVLPELLRRPHGWPDVGGAVRELHFPGSWDSLAQAKERLAFEELFLFQLALAQRRAKTLTTTKPQRYQPEGPLMRTLGERLPFALTASQRQVLEELRADLARVHPMHRLLQGDVGCGKTIVIIHLVALAVQSGYQAALMAPTELLAEQHARVVGSYLEPLGVSVGLLSQAVPPAERTKRLAAIASGELPVIVGTHALIQSAVRFKRLALVVIDEQHKFGVAQRAHLARKAQAPDVLVVTATPIPRTLALTIYGDLDVSTITELPSGRQPVTTRWLREAERPALEAMIRQALSRGEQGYIVYPVVEEHASRELRAATQMAKRLQADVFPEFRVGLLHGQMRPALKERTMRAFARGEVQLLVTTVIVEVGLDVPNATIMVVEHPERFGLAQLHQLRGRIGRSSLPATCVVISDAEDALVRERLAVFVKTSDGFELAEKDLEQRGPGELLGRRQHGWLRFRLANLVRDGALLETAREEARTLASRDPALRDPQLAPLRRRLAQFREQHA